MTIQTKGPPGWSRRASEDLSKSSANNHTTTKPRPPYSKGCYLGDRVINILYGWPGPGIIPSPNTVVLPESRPPAEFNWSFIKGHHVFVAPMIESGRQPRFVPRETAIELGECLVTAGALSIVIFGADLVDGELIGFHWWPPGLVPTKNGGCGER